MLASVLTQLLGKVAEAMSMHAKACNLPCWNLAQELGQQGCKHRGSPGAFPKQTKASSPQHLLATVLKCKFTTYLATGSAVQHITC